MELNLTGFTIGIPAYERAEYTREALESCLKQNYGAFEIVICDDSRSNAVQEMVKEYTSEKIRYFKNPATLGLPQNCNRLLELSQNPWMVILANDDLLEPDYLREVDAVIQKRPEAAVVRVRYAMVDEKGGLIREDGIQPFEQNSFEFLNRAFLRGNVSTWMSLSAVAFPIARMRQIGGFRDFRRGHHMDRVAWSELAVWGPAFFLPMFLAKIRSHREEITTTLDPDYQEALKANLKMSQVMMLLFDQMKTKVKLEEDQKLLDEARTHLELYSIRQAGRALDQGIMAGIESENLQTVHDLRQIKKQMHFNPRTFFRSYYFYKTLLMMPRFMRKYFIPILKEYKLRKWHS